MACDKVVPSYSGLKVPKKVHSSYSGCHGTFLISHFLYCEQVFSEVRWVSANVCEE